MVLFFAQKSLKALYLVGKLLVLFNKTEVFGKDNAFRFLYRSAFGCLSENGGVMGGKRKYLFLLSVE